MTDSDVPPGLPTRAREFYRRLLEVGPLVASGLAAILVFLFAVQLLGTATEAAGVLLERAFRLVVVDDASTLGLSWLATYGLTNGSVVAALGVSLLRSGIVSPGQAFLVVVGSRLGGAAIVVLVGAFEYLQHRQQRTLGEGLSLGLLTFVVTFTIYLPVAVAGIVLRPAVQPVLLDASRTFDLPVRLLQYLDPATRTVTSRLGPGLALAVAIVLLFGSLWLFDRVLERVETRTIRRYVVRHLQRRWTAFTIGFVVTGATTSVAFSLGVIVPLYNRQYVRREEIVPYVLGANIGTLLDTLVVAVVLETAAGVAIVLLVMGLATLFTLVALVVYEPYAAVVDAGQDRLLGDRRFLVGFGVLLVAVPLALLLVPHA